MRLWKWIKCNLLGRHNSFMADSVYEDGIKVADVHYCRHCAQWLGATLYDAEGRILPQ